MYLLFQMKKIENGYTPYLQQYDDTASLMCTEFITDCLSDFLSINESGYYTTFNGIEHHTERLNFQYFSKNEEFCTLTTSKDREGHYIILIKKRKLYEDDFSDFVPYLSSDAPDNLRKLIHSQLIVIDINLL